MGIPEKAYDRLHNLGKHWGIAQEDIYIMQWKMLCCVPASGYLCVM
jgi:hypothetical protein